MSWWLPGAVLVLTSCAGCKTIDQSVGPTSPTSVSPGVTEQMLDPTSNFATQQRAVRKRALQDLDCPETSIEVEDLGSAHYRAAGCGRSAIYKCVGGGSDRNLPRCDREASP